MITDEWIAARLTEAPPLTDDQADHLWAIFHPKEALAIGVALIQLRAMLEWIERLRARTISE